MSDFDRVREILAAATPGPWVRWYDDYEGGTWCIGPDADRASDVASSVPSPDARAIVTAVNLAPEWNAVAEAARTYLWSPDSFDDYDPADIPDDEWAPEALALRAALDALYAKMKETLP